jgi:hypothetical protein
MNKPCQAGPDFIPSECRSTNYEDTAWPKTGFAGLLWNPVHCSQQLLLAQAEPRGWVAQGFRDRVIV